MTAVIDYVLNTSTISPLLPGQLGYSYLSNTLYIGPPDLSQNGTSLVELIRFQNNILNFILQEVQSEITDRIPSSNAIFQALSKKAGLETSNTFSAANYFPDVDILNTPITQEKLVVNVKSIKSYLNGVVNQLRNDILSEFPGLPHCHRYDFLLPSDKWIIQHDSNTDILEMTIYELGTNRQMIAPFEIIDNYTVHIYFSKPVAGYVDVEFFS